MLLSTLILSTVSFFQKVSFGYLYLMLILYLLLIWASYIVWLWNDSKKRFSNEPMRFLIWVFASVTFIFGLFLYLLIRPQQLDEDTYWVSLERKFLIHETYGMGECEDCGFTLRPEFMMCPSCGKILREKCKKCEQSVDVKWKRCAYCGTVRIKEKHKEEVEERKSFDISVWMYQQYNKVLSYFKNLFLKGKEYFNSISKYVSSAIDKVEESLTKRELELAETVQKKPETKKTNKNSKGTKSSQKKEVEKKDKKEVKEINRESHKEEKLIIKHVRRLLFLEEKIPAKKEKE